MSDKVVDAFWQPSEPDNNIKEAVMLLEHEVRIISGLSWNMLSSTPHYEDDLELKKKKPQERY